jgi:5'-methylthioadenosine phosphorylase
VTGSVLGVLGGSGLYDLDGLDDPVEVDVDTPYGPPSDKVLRARLGDTALLFLPRHGRGHRIPPHAINYRANVCAMKKLGATHLASVSATGSMKEHIAPGDLVVVSQFVDLTRRRASSFFDEGAAAHVAFSDPVCPLLSAALHRAAEEVAAAARARGGRTRVHEGATYLCIEGPQFSTRAESAVYRSWGVDVIGMTNMPEAKLAREAELPYATLALATDYDCWHASEGPVDVAAVVARLGTMVALARDTVRRLAGRLPDASASPAAHALREAVMTAPDRIPAEARARLAWLLGPP